MNQKMLVVMTMCVSLAIVCLAVSPIKALSGTTTSEVSIPQSFSFADKVSVSVEKHVEITQNFSLVDSWTATLTGSLPPSSAIAQAAAQIVQGTAEEAVKTPQKKVTSYGPIFWQGDPLINSPEWSWIPAGIVAILGIVIIGRLRLPCISLKHVVLSNRVLGFNC